MWWSPLVVLLLVAVASAADFPEPAKLPDRPGLPDPLVTLAGEKVTSKQEWFEKRRPELKDLFQHYMYGYLPPVTKVEVVGVRKSDKAFGGKATLKEVELKVGPEGSSHVFLLVAVPNNRKGPAPCFVGMNFSGNHSLVADPMVRVPTAWVYDRYPGVKNNRATEEGRGKQADVWALEQSIDRGYAVAPFYSGDIDPDRTDVREGIQQYLYPKGDKAGPDRAGTIAVWAWGVHRAVDYLITDKDVDPKRIAVVGHSRLGKTALLAAAFDDRIALAIPHQAGCGGTAPSRGKVGESVTRINTSFPHWFCGNFKQFNDRPEKLPFDQNCLAAIVAPRPVLFSNAVEDTWANPEGQFEVLKAAEPVYKLLGAGGLAAEKVPELDKLVDSTLGYYVRPGKHSMTKGDWKVFLDFADKHLGKPGEGK